MVGKYPSSGVSWIFWIRLCFSIIHCISVYITKHELKALNQHFLQQSQYCALATTVDQSYHIIIKLLLRFKNQQQRYLGRHATSSKNLQI